MNLKILLEKNKERENRKSEGETREEEEKKKKAMAALLVFMLTSLEIFFERKRLFEGNTLFWL